MKAASAIVIPRSVADGDPILVELRLNTTAGELAVADAAIVSLRVLIDGAVVAIAGVAYGAGSGIWAFAPEGLPLVAGRLPFSITVTADGFTYAHGRGVIDLVERV